MSPYMVFRSMEWSGVLARDSVGSTLVLLLTKNLSLCSSVPHHLTGKNSGNLSSLLTEIIYYQRGNKDCSGYKWVVTLTLEQSGPTNCNNLINLLITNYCIQSASASGAAWSTLIGREWRIGGFHAQKGPIIGALMP